MTQSSVVTMPTGAHSLQTGYAKRVEEGIWAELQLEIMLVCEVKLSASLSSVHLDLACHTAGLLLQTTVTTQQQMDVTVWSRKHFTLQNNECFVQRRTNSILAAGWLTMSQREEGGCVWDGYIFEIDAVFRWVAAYKSSSELPRRWKCKS